MLCIYAQALHTLGTADTTEGARTVAARLKDQGFEAGRTTILKHRRGGCVCGKTKAETPELDMSGGNVEVGPEGGEFRDIKTSQPLTDWSAIFQRFNLDPAEFTIVGDTVRMSMWQQSRRTDDGNRDVVNLYSYRAQFTRKAAAGVDLTSLIQSVRATPKADKPARVSDGLTYVVALADLQLGKGEGDGTKGTLARLKRAQASILADIDNLRSIGVNLDRVLIANMGDHTEGVQGSYASQTHTVDLNTRDQIQLALEVNLDWIKTLVPRFAHATYSACLCNHGQLARGAGRDNVTDDADNATGLIGDTLQTVCGLHDDLKSIDWVIPRDDMLTLTEASGVNIAMSHGHKISGKEEDWLARQSQYLTQAKGFIPGLWLVAHKHHAAVTDYGPYTRIQATTVDPGSKWYLDSSGMYARAGVTTFVTGANLAGRYDYHRVH